MPAAPSPTPPTENITLSNSNSAKSEKNTNDGALLDVGQALAAQRTPESRKWTGKKLAVTASPGGFGHTPILRLPVECLAHLLACLDPPSLAIAQRVCQHWKQVIHDEHSWRAAFETYYSLTTALGVIALGRRLEPHSWRAEYINRVSLISRWTKSRNASVIHDPALGPITSLHLDLSPTTVPNPSRTITHGPTLLSLSLTLGRARRSNPFTGIRVKNSTPLEATATDHHGNAIGVPLFASCVGVSHDGLRIVWGMENGSLRMNTVDSGSLAERAWGGDGLRILDGVHGREITALSFGVKGRNAIGNSKYFVSVGAEGKVAIWTLQVIPVAVPAGGVTSGGAAARAQLPRPRNQPFARLVWSSILPSSPTSTSARAPQDSPAVGTVVSFDAGKAGGFASLAVGMSNGDAHVWSGVSLLEGGGRSLAEQYYFIAGSDESGSIDTLQLDVSSTVSLLVHTKDASHFHRYSFSAHPSTDPPAHTIFGHKPDLIGPITAFACDFDAPPPVPLPSTASGIVNSISIASIASYTSESSSPAVEAEPVLTGSNAFGRRKYVVAGDSQGRVFIWDWEALLEEDEGKIVLPRTMLQGFSCKVTALEIGEALIFVGGLDGTLRCYDPLTSSLLRTFKDRTASRLPARLLQAGLIDATEEDRWKVSCIVSDRESVVAAVGGSIVAWRVTEETKKKKKTGKGNGKAAFKSERVHSEYTLREDVDESVESISNESSSRIARMGRERQLAVDYGLPPSLDNMTEDEAVALAVMLSSEDEEARWLREIEENGWSSSTRTSPAFEAIEEDMDMEELDLESGNTEFSSRSLSIPTSPSIRGSSLSIGGSSSSPSSRTTSQNWRPASQRSSPSFPAYRPHSYDSTGSNHKIQLSPRLGPTYGSARSIPTSPVPDMREELWPIARSSTSSPMTSQFPALSPTAPSTPLTPSTPASTSVRRGWNEIARSASSTPGFSTPSKSAGGSSLLAVSLSRGISQLGFEGMGDRRREEEDELKFAIELSLAEEASRLSLEQE